MAIHSSKTSTATWRRWVTDQLGEGGANSLAVEDEGSSLDVAVTKLNFKGVGVSAVENANHEIDITISGSGLFSEDSDGNIVGGTGAGANLVGASALENFLAGQDAGSAITTGDYNVVLGFQSLQNALAGSNNIAIGLTAGNAVINAFDNICIGQFIANTGILGESNVFIGPLIASLGTLTVAAAGNIALGNKSLERLETGSENTAAGWQSGRRVTTGVDNSFFGTGAGGAVTTGSSNTAIGRQALFHSSASATGADNIAIGQLAMASAVITSANNNIAIGASSLTSITTGDDNIILGSLAGAAISTGGDNIAIGGSALNDLTTSYGNVAIGYRAGEKIGEPGADNVLLGRSSGAVIAAGSHNTCIGGYTGVKLNVNSTANVVIGFNAGPTVLEAKNNRLWIHNSQSDTPLIGGDFSAGTVDIEGTLTLQGVFLPKLATDAALNAIANAINTAASKVQGAMVYNTSTDNPVYAVGNTDGAIWVDGSGATANTPV